MSTASCGVEERARRQVDRDRQLVALRPATRGTGASRRSSTQRVSGDDQAGLLGERHELVGADQAVARVVPAHERLDADDAAADDVGLRLVVQLELAALDRRAQLAGERQAARASAVLLRLVERDAAAALLGRVHGDVGALDAASRRRSPCVGMAGDADRARDLERQPVDHERLAQRAQQHLGDGHASSAPLTAGSSTPNSSPPRRATVSAVAQRGRRAARRPPASSTVAVVVAERVVDLLEAVEVHEHHREAAVAARRRRERLLDAVAEQRAVRQAGQGVVQRLVLLGDRLAAAAVDGEQRQEQQRQDGEREVGGEHDASARGRAAGRRSTPGGRGRGAR